MADEKPTVDEALQELASLGRRIAELADTFEAHRNTSVEGVEPQFESSGDAAAAATSPGPTDGPPGCEDRLPAPASLVGPIAVDSSAVVAGSQPRRGGGFRTGSDTEPGGGRGRGE